jgi:hypothetical protein
LQHHTDFEGNIGNPDMAAPPIEFALHFDFTHRVLLLTFGRTVTKATLLAAYDAVEQFVAAQGACRGIVNFSAVENTEISADSIRSIAERPPAFPPGMKRVFVAPRPSAYGFSRMYQILRQDLEGDLEVVHTLAEAYGVLGFESATFEPIVITEAPRSRE